MINSDCLNIPLIKTEKIQIFLEYCIPITFLEIFLVLNIFNILPIWINKAVFFGFCLCAPFEFIQPRLGWVYYYKCITYKLLPMKFTWILQAMWDSLVLLLITGFAVCLFGSEILYNYNCYIAVFFSCMGMLQEIFLECTQTIWYYKPTKFNPTWAIINGRNMTLQQWHWSILPIIYYNYILYLNT
jgi:hypothetical protein